MENKQILINNLYKGQSSLVTKENDLHKITMLQNFIIDSNYNVKKRVGTNFITSFTNGNILKVSFNKLLNYNVMLQFLNQQLFIYKEEENNYNNKPLFSFSTPWQSVKEADTCSILEYEGKIYIFSIQGSYVIEDIEGNVICNSFEFYDGPWHSFNNNRNHFIYAEKENGITYVKSKTNVFKSYMQGYLMQIVSQTGHVGFVKILEYVSATVLKVEAFDVMANAETNFWCLGGFVAKDSNIKKLSVLIKDNRLYIAYSNAIKGNVVVSVSFLHEFERFSLSEHVSNIQTTPATKVYAYTEKSGYYYEIDDASEVSFLVEAGDYLALGTNNGIFHLSVSTSFTEKTKRELEFAKINNANVAGQVDFSDLNSIFAISSNKSNIVLYNKENKYEKVVLNTQAFFNENNATLSNICYSNNPYRMIFTLKNNYEIILATYDYHNSKTLSFKTLVLGSHTKDGSYIKIHAIALNSLKNKLYILIEREANLINLECLNLNHFSYNNLSPNFYLDSCSSFYPKQRGYY